MQFTPKSTTELEEERKARMKLMDPGPADFIVKSAIDCLSNTDNTEQIELKVEVTDAHGNSKVITDYLTPKMMGKMRNFCYATGVGSLYDQGTLMAEHCDGLGGRCLIGIERSRDKQYPDKNRIQDYLANSGNASVAAAAQRPAPKSPAAAAPEAAVAMRKAQTAYKVKFPATPRDELIEGWNQRVKKYFFGKMPEMVSAAEWNQFVRDDFTKPAPPAPFGDEVQFKEEDIPF